MAAFHRQELEERADGLDAPRVDGVDETILEVDGADAFVADAIAVDTAAQEAVIGGSGAGDGVGWHLVDARTSRAARAVLHLGGLSIRQGQDLQFSCNHYHDWLLKKRWSYLVVL